ncbi:MAG: cell division protein ZapB [Pseudomonadota bacterium]
MVENEMLLMQQFEEIEQKLERLIAICSSLEVKNIQLGNTISSLEAELRFKTEALENYSEERTMIRSRIDTLLVKLENIAEMDSNSSQ